MIRRCIETGFVALLVLCGCAELEFDLPSIVRGPRVLAVIADRPEVAPGDEVRVHALIADPRPVAERGEVELRWTMCLASGGLASGGFGGAGAFGVSAAEQFGASVAEPGCEVGSPFTTALAVEGSEAIVPGECADPARPWQCTRGILELFAAVGSESGVPPALIEQIADTVGIAITVHVEVYVEGALEVRAFKRINITRRGLRSTNPPPPRFAVGDVWMSARGESDPHICAPERGERPVVAGLAEVQLRPDPTDLEWLETFPIVSLDGTAGEGRENAYYTWFSTAGEWDPAVSVAPTRNTVWLSPDAVGIYPIWVVVRDGHLGQSACRIEVEVVDVVPPYSHIERL